uniref:Uncharacterized protein n=1 Tax=Aegilops tauschii subsp. strangulata TaxID=200361 RepID=A0A452ZDT0_AEGTS
MIGVLQDVQLITPSKVRVHVQNTCNIFSKSTCSEQTLAISSVRVHVQNKHLQYLLKEIVYSCRFSCMFRIWKHSEACSEHLHVQNTY